jgi:8-oxo-dGTP diphosphatase
MKPRAAVIIIEKDKIALIERFRSGKRYFVFPGGKIKTNESAVEAAGREAEEELGLKIRIGKMVAEVWYLGSPQYYFLAESISGKFGTGDGAELTSPPESERGSYLPVWISVDSLVDCPVLPTVMAEFVQNSYRGAWPANPLVVTDRSPNEMTDTRSISI